jgi:alpha-tubulin suppressor-like RCC1 family protein
LASVVLAASSIGLQGCKDLAGPNDRHYMDVATGGFHTCAITETGEAYCWGRGADGELGTGSVSNESFPQPVRTSLKFKQITAGAAHTCALAQNDRVYCWGWSAFYQIGDTTSYPHLEPEPIGLDSTFQQVSAGDYHTCAIATSSRVYCWGYNRFGQAGNRSTEVAIYPIPVAGDFRASAISAGGHHTCAIAVSGGAFCWGSNVWGQLGIASDRPYVAEPVALSGSFQFTSIDAGENHTCAVDRSGSAFCWGYNEFGQIGDAGAFRPGLNGPASPTSVLLLSGVVRISAGANHTCALDGSGRTWCWGRGAYGQLGIGTTIDHAVRQPLVFQPTLQNQSDYLKFEKLATGGAQHACALGEGSIFCWGTGRFGQLGSRTTHVLTPQRVND